MCPRPLPPAQEAVAGVTLSLELGHSHPTAAHGGSALPLLPLCSTAFPPAPEAGIRSDGFYFLHERSVVSSVC